MTHGSRLADAVERAVQVAACGDDEVLTLHQCGSDVAGASVRLNRLAGKLGHNVARCECGVCLSYRATLDLRALLLHAAATRGTKS